MKSVGFCRNPRQKISKLREWRNATLPLPLSLAVFHTVAQFVDLKALLLTGIMNIADYWEVVCCVYKHLFFCIRLCLLIKVSYAQSLV